MIPSALREEPSPHRFIGGIATSAAIYVPVTKKRKRQAAEFSHMSVPLLIRLIDSGHIRSSDISQHLHSVTKNRTARNKEYYASLQALEEANQVYAHLAGAQVKLQVTSSPLSRSKWWKTTELNPRLATLLGCIAYFETGTLDIEPAQLRDRVFAASHGSSIYLSLGIFSQTQQTQMLRLRSSISRATLASQDWRF